MKKTMLAVGLMLAVISAGLLGVVVLASQGDLLKSDGAWLEPYVGSGGVVAAGIAMVAAAVMIGIGLGRWEDPKPVPTATERHHEGLQG